MTLASWIEIQRPAARSLMSFNLYRPDFYAPFPLSHRVSAASRILSFVVSSDRRLVDDVRLLTFRLGISFSRFLFNFRRLVFLARPYPHLHLIRSATGKNMDNSPLVFFFLILARSGVFFLRFHHDSGCPRYQVMFLPVHPHGNCPLFLCFLLSVDCSLTFRFSFR